MTVRHIVAMSGGKDSTATGLLAREMVQAEALEYVFADTGNEHQVTYDYVYEYLPKALGFPIKVVRADFTIEFAEKRAKLARIAAGEPEQAVYGNREFAYPWTQETAARALELLHPTGNPFLDMCMLHGGFPSVRKQYCTEYLKRNPMLEHQDAQIAVYGAVWSWQGVRADEGGAGGRRAHLRGTGGCDKRFEVVGGGLYIHRPIIRWKAADCFDTLKHCGVKPNPLYLQGFSRVGCFPCINATKPEIVRIGKRGPEHISRISEWEALVNSGARPRSPVHFFQRPTGGAQDVDAIVRWAATSRGGRQTNFFNDLEDDATATSCSSVYGLCE